MSLGGLLRLLSFLKAPLWLFPLVLGLLKQLLPADLEVPGQTRVYPAETQNPEQERQLAVLRRRTLQALWLAGIAVLFSLVSLAWVIGGRHQLPTPAPTAHGNNAPPPPQQPG